MRLLFFLSLLTPLLAVADDVSDWARARVRAQKEGLATTPVGTPGEADPVTPTIWRERTIIPFWKEKFPGGPSVAPSFTPPASLAPLVRAVRAGVVNISAKNEGTSKGLGSGFIITSDGLVVTNNHVIERAQSIVVRLADGRSLEAKVVGRDPEVDLALLRLTGAADLPVVTLGNSDELEVGDWVVAIGNPFGLDTSLTHGLISARERIIGVGPFDDFIQTNALINPGNSGGPLFDMKGHVVGVTTAIMNQGQGIGFAVPVNLVKDLLPNLRDNGTPVRGWLGVTVSEVKDSSESVIVDVYPESPAARAGLQAGDRLVAINGKPVEKYQQLLRRIAIQGPGVVVKLGVVRNGKVINASALLTTRPSAGPTKTMMSGGRVDSLGLVLGELEPSEGQGVRIEAVLPGSVAELGGLTIGDVIVELNRVKVVSLRQLQETVAQTPAGEPVLLKFTRGEVSRYLALKRRS
ncbi:MAG: trypsin-like peptidase domain-containing protein [Myxococcales bacterium]|nr:trypsin-like peptidase domain-containing protein [Myxococcales bacterium]